MGGRVVRRLPAMDVYVPPKHRGQSVGDSLGCRGSGSSFCTPRNYLDVVWRTITPEVARVSIAAPLCVKYPLPKISDSMTAVLNAGNTQSQPEGNTVAEGDGE